MAETGDDKFNLLELKASDLANNAEIEYNGQSYKLSIDAGDGNDTINISGASTIVAGGLGRDLIFNHTAGGIIWGDVANSIIDGELPKTSFAPHSLLREDFFGRRPKF